MRFALPSLVLVVLLAGAALPAEQTVTPVPAPSEQRVEPVQAASEQHVQAIDPAEAQRVSMAEKGPVRRGAEIVGKAALVTVAFAVSIGFTLASLLLF